jgi:vacuolar-type H+-ATPase subunit I/STV1
MKKLTLFLVFIFALYAGNAFAQRPAQNIDPEKLQAARIAFITSRIDLKPDQAEKFWPLFNQYNEQRESTMKSMSELNRDIENISEEEAKSRIQKRLQLQQKMIDAEKSFTTDISKVITSKQLLMLNNIARDFNRHIYQRQRGPNN